MLEEEVDQYFGYPNEELARKVANQNFDKLSDEYLVKVGILLSMCDDDELCEKAKSILIRLKKKHDRAAPFMLLKWLTQIQQGKEGLEGQIYDWAKQHPDNTVYSRAHLWLKSKTLDSIAMIGEYVKYLEVYWNDDLSWQKLGDLYMEEKLYDRAAFSYEEAIGLSPKTAKFYKLAAKARMEIETNKDQNISIATKQLSKALLLDENDDEAWELIMSITTNEQNLAKYRAYYNTIVKQRAKK